MSASDDRCPLATEHLRPEHLALLKGSAISDQVARQRGYRSVTSKAELKRLGFSDRQARTPALLIPIWDVHGQVATYQARPNDPRVDERRTIKYETPVKTRLVIDAPPRVREALSDPSKRLFITEGTRKADSGASQGLTIIGLMGVWGWLGTNPQGGKTALIDWRSIALNGREVFLCFDSDVTTKSAVYQALAQLKEFLESRGADVAIIYLPPGEGAAKVGLDDFLFRGGTVEQLLALAERSLRPPPIDSNAPSKPKVYFDQDGCTYWNKPSGDGVVPLCLCNFTARIRADVCVDDGVEQRREYAIDLVLGGRPAQVHIPARNFAGMTWVSDALGAYAIVSPGVQIKDHLRVAIQTLSESIERQTVYAHTGWRQIPSVGWVYLHAGGAIGPKGPQSDIQVRLPESLRAATLPAPPSGAELVAAVEAALESLRLAPDRLVYAGLALVFRAPLGDTDFSGLVFGPTGCFKTEFAALLQSYFGEGYGSRSLPGSWLSTANSLEMLAFTAKDSLLTIDDFVPDGSRQDIQRQNRDIGRLLRGQGNRAGRGRCGPDGSLKAGREPRGLVVTTAEELPSRHSARARAMILEVGAREIDQPQLTECQRRMATGIHAQLMSAFLTWIAPQYPELKKALNARAIELRDAAQQSGRHQRTASTIGQLQAGFELFLTFATAVKALTNEQVHSHRMRCWEALLASAKAQAQYHRTAEPSAVFVRLLRSAISSGMCHLATTEGGTPPTPEAFGWRRFESSKATDSFGETLYRAQGARVGWIDGDNVYLDPDASLKAAQSMASDVEHIPVTTSTLGKRLKERGLLARTDEARGHLLVRVAIEGRRASVLHLKHGVLTGAAHSAQPSQTATDDDEKADLDTDLWAETLATPPESSPAIRPTGEVVGTHDIGAGPSGPKGPPTAAKVGSDEDGDEQSQWSPGEQVRFDGVDYAEDH